MDIYKEYQEIFDYADILAKRMYRFNIVAYRERGLEVQDLMQEAKLQAFKLITKYKDMDREKLKNVVNKYVKLNLYRLRQHYADAMRHQVEVGEADLYRQLHDKDYTPDEEEEYSEDGTIPKTELEAYLQNQHYDQPDSTPLFIFEDLKQLCNIREYKSLQLRFQQAKSYVEIAKDLNLTKMGALKLCKRALGKVRKKIKRSLLLEKFGI